MDVRELLRGLGAAWSSSETPTGWTIKCPLHPELDAKISHLEVVDCPSGCTYEDYVDYIHGLIDEKVSSAAAMLPPVPIEVYPEGIQKALLRAHENTGAPLAYFVLGALPVAATALGASAKIYVNPGWKERACFHVALMGASGQGKDPALNMLIRPLEIAEIRLNEGNRKAMEVWEQLDKKIRGPMPRQHELLQKDVTTEATGESLEANPEGVLMYDGELVGLVKAIGQYKNGGGSDRQTFLNYWPGTMAKYKRKGKMALIIPNPTVNILGGLQDKLFSALGGDDGLRPRFLFAVGDRRRTDRFFRQSPSSTEIQIITSEVAYAEWTEAIVKLNGSRNRGGTELVCIMTLEAQALAEPFLLRLENELGVGDSEVAEMYRKMKGYLFRIALVLHALDCVESGEAMGEIGVKVMERTITLLDWCIKAAILVLTNDDGSTPADRDRVAKWTHLATAIEKQRSRGVVSLTWIRRSGPVWARACDRRSLDEALEALGYDRKIERRITGA